MLVRVALYRRQVDPSLFLNGLHRVAFYSRHRFLLSDTRRTVATALNRPLQYDALRHCCHATVLRVVASIGSWFKSLVWYGMVDVYDGYLAAEASGSSFG